MINWETVNGVLHWDNGAYVDVNQAYACEVTTLVEQYGMPDRVDLVTGYCPCGQARYNERGKILIGDRTFYKCGQCGSTAD